MRGRVMALSILLLNEVTGTKGGRPFRDVVDTFTTFCRDGTRTGTTPACDAFAAEHGY